MLRFGDVGLYARPRLPPVLVDLATFTCAATGAGAGAGAGAGEGEGFGAGAGAGAGAGEGPRPSSTVAQFTPPYRAGSFQFCLLLITSAKLRLCICL